MPLVLHAHPVSQPTRAINWFMKANGITGVGFVFVDFVTGQHLSAEFTQKSIYQAVPILELEDGSYLSESAAILNYLAVHFGKRAEYPADAVKAARIHEAELHHDSLARVITVECVRPFLPVLLKKATIDVPLAAIEKSKGKVAEALATLNTVLGGRPFIAGEAFTVADYLVACELSQLPMLAKLGIPEVLHLTTYPNLVAYIDRVRAHSPLYDEFLVPFEQAFAGLVPK